MSDCGDQIITYLPPFVTDIMEEFLIGAVNKF